MKTARLTFLIFLRRTSRPLVWFGIALTALILALPAHAQNFSVLHAFHGTKQNDGASPYGGLVADSHGNFFGTTVIGGKFDYGTVYELPAGGGEKVLHEFSGGLDGAEPIGSLLIDAAGNLYGTTKLGGNPNCGDIGCGVIFKISPEGNETVLYYFHNGQDGGFPIGGLVRDAAGNFYGTAGGGGTLAGACGPLLGCGVVYKLDAGGHQIVLHTFTNAPDGSSPDASLTLDAEGNLYGTTPSGGNGGCVNSLGCGTVFTIDAQGHESVLYRFSGGADGAKPGFGGLLRDDAGNLYGTTEAGGVIPCTPTGPQGCGVVFKIDTAGHQSVLHVFTGGADGAVPVAGLVRDAAGDLFGTASGGGSFSGICQSTGCGVVFELTPVGNEIVLHTFKVADGATPFSGLLPYQGFFYGTTLSGGGNLGDGVAYKVAP